MTRSTMTRRSWLASSLALPCLPWRASIARTRQQEIRRLVVVELLGGNDGLNSVVPYRNDGYRRARPVVGIPRDAVLPIDDELGFHPALRPFADLLQWGRLAIVQGVGHPELSRSHFEARKQWYAGNVDPMVRTPGGWLGRAGRDRDLEQSVFVGSGRPSPALEGRGVAAPSIERADQLAFPRHLGVTLPQAVTASGGAADRMDTDLVAAARRARETAFRVDRDLKMLARARALSEFGTIDSATRATTIVDRLRFAAELVRTELPVSVIYTTQGDYDTHQGQLLRHQTLLSQLAQAIEAFRAMLAGTSAEDRTLLMVFSEFGRTLRDNASAGTDHGSQGPVFVVGKAVRPGFHGQAPELVDESTFLEREPRPSTDFRSIYATVLDSWLEVDSSAVLGERVAPVSFLA